MVTACEQAPRVSARQAVMTRPSRPQDPPEDDPPAGNAPKTPPPPPKPQTGGFFLNSLPTIDSVQKASPAKTTGVTDYSYRWYDPVTGRWPSRDTIGEYGGINLYAFVKNNGVVLIDYLGFVDINYNPDGKDADGNKSKKSEECFKGFADNAPDNEAAITILGHGSPSSIRDDRPGKAGALTPEDVANDVKNHEDFDKTKRIILYSCETGKGPESFAQQLADLTGIEVAAPSELLWCGPDGKARICKCVDEKYPYLRIIPSNKPGDKGMMKIFPSRNKEKNNQESRKDNNTKVPINPDSKIQ